jgi:hypothetical protein
MRIVPFDSGSAEPVVEFDSQAVSVVKVARGSGEAPAYLLPLEQGGVIEPPDGGLGGRLLPARARARRWRRSLLRPGHAARQARAHRRRHLLIDEDIAIIGSANIDMRSLFLNYEIALVLTSVATATALDAWFRDLFSACLDLEPAGRVRAILEPVARLLAPLE